MQRSTNIRGWFVVALVIFDVVMVAYVVAQLVKLS